LSPIKKSDVKSHLTARNRHGIHLYRPGVEPKETDFSDGKSEHENADTLKPAIALPNQPLSSIMTIPSVRAEPDSSDVATLAESKSGQE
jgi:hypothetical protein